MAHQDFDDGLLDCTVSSPQKESEGTQNTHVSYLVTTKTNFKTFQKPSTTVRRRFTDFLFLSTTLSREYPAVAVPPLPEKHNTAYLRGGARFTSDFTERRARSLHRFLRRIALHPELRRAAVLLQFLESPEWHSTMKSRMPSGSSPRSGSDGGGGGSGALETWTDSFLNAFAKVHKPDKRFIEVREKADKLGEDLGSVEKSVARVARRQADLGADYDEVAGQFQKLQVLEPGVAQPLTGFAVSVRESSEAWMELRNHTDRDYLTSLKDMEAYIASLKALLKAREQKQLDFEGLSDYLAKAAADRDTLASHQGSSGLGVSGLLRSKIEDVRGVDHEKARRDRIRKLEMEIERLTREVENAKVASEMFDDRTVREVQEFERIKSIELQDTLGDLADAHIDFFGKTVETWEKFVAQMEEEGVTAAE
ncbi:Phox-like protein [Microthyrium microscopicum]|uniref:Sorting nexin-4 n=1 Tax=Microthyrium microscopicum TaxID=703497 RepID=A0A6A6URQ4_9PEZI|nr:Phox-like protein [Microthyrium microscopicum]